MNTNRQFRRKSDKYNYKSSDFLKQTAVVVQLQKRKKYRLEQNNQKVMISFQDQPFSWTKFQFPKKADFSQTTLYFPLYCQRSAIFILTLNWKSNDKFSRTKKIAQKKNYPKQAAVMIQLQTRKKYKLEQHIQKVMNSFQDQQNTEKIKGIFSLVGHD